MNPVVSRSCCGHCSTAGLPTLHSAANNSAVPGGHPAKSIAFRQVRRRLLSFNCPYSLFAICTVLCLLLPIAAARNYGLFKPVCLLSALKTVTRWPPWKRACLSSIAWLRQPLPFLWIKFTMAGQVSAPTSGITPDAIAWRRSSSASMRRALGLVLTPARC